MCFFSPAVSGEGTSWETAWLTVPERGGGMRSQKGFFKRKLARRMLRGWRRMEKGGIAAALAPAAAAALDTVTSQTFSPDSSFFEQILGEENTVHQKVVREILS